MGIAQAFAVLPGISRSGATIATGLVLGTDRKKVASFSFLMAIPPILGASILEVFDLTQVSTIEKVPWSSLMQRNYRLLGRCFCMSFNGSSRAAK